MRTPTRSTRGGRALAVVLCCVAALSLLAGCSRKKDGAKPASPSPTAKPLSREEYATRANKVCADNLPTPIPRPNNAADFVAGIKAHIAQLKNLQSKLRELTPPDADKQEIERNLLKPRDQQIAAFEEELPRIQEAAAAGDLNAAMTASIPAIQTSVNLHADTQPFIDSYGVHPCGF